jgi:ATP-dependent exoDNAse (exonuclease V) alpha subunit
MKPQPESSTQEVLAGHALLIVGDIDQLPSVGPGQVLADVISSGGGATHRGVVERCELRDNLLVSLLVLLITD